MTGAEDTPPPKSPVGSSTAFIRALALEIDDAATGNLTTVRELLAQGTPAADRSAVRMLAVWLISHPEAAEAIRSRLRAP